MAKFPGVLVGNMACRYSWGEGGEVGPWINLLKAWLGIMLGQDMEICPNPIARQPFKILRESQEKMVCFCLDFNFNL